MNTAKLLAISTVAAICLSSSMAAAAGDVKKGEKIFKKCKSCHTANEGGKNKSGPNLFGIVGRTAASVEGYKYSKAMKASGLTWDAATLDSFLTKPKKFVKKTKMSFSGIKKEKQRADLIAYLETMK
ncbi:MAG: cytochrome c family protein [Sneathiella sp.]|nr:cytochrome c family protein [Sneathiella sp.]